MQDLPGHDIEVVELDGAAPLWDVAGRMVVIGAGLTAAEKCEALSSLFSEPADAEAVVPPACAPVAILIRAAAAVPEPRAS